MRTTVDPWRREGGRTLSSGGAASARADAEDSSATLPAITIVAVALFMVVVPLVRSATPHPRGLRPGDPPSVAVARVVIVIVAPAATSPSRQTIGSASLHEPSELLTDRTRTPAGTESVTTASTAVDAPALRTLSMEVKSSDAVVPNCFVTVVTGIRMRRGADRVFNQRS
jgi:hypothetical protein